MTLLQLRGRLIRSGERIWHSGQIGALSYFIAWVNERIEALLSEKMLLELAKMDVQAILARAGSICVIAQVPFRVQDDELLPIYILRLPLSISSV